MALVYYYLLAGFFGILFQSAVSQVVYPSDEPVREVYGQCTAADNRGNGECVTLRDCAELLAVYEQNPSSALLRRSRCGQNRFGPLVCCPIIVPDTQPTTAGSNLFPEPGECGILVSDKIFGGVNTAISEYIFMALLEYTKPTGETKFGCGGALINNRYILTAAHCINPKKAAGTQYAWDLTSVRLGEWDLSTSQDCDDECSSPPVNVQIQEKIVHEGYDTNSRNQVNDIALLRLARNVPYTDWIRPICLPRSDDLINENFAGIRMDVTGWGTTENASSSNIKLKAAVEVRSLEQCRSVYGPRRVELQDTQFCAGGEKGVDSCRGDSGGPLIGLNRRSRRPYNFIAGIVSFGPVPCGLENFPGVYTRVNKYISWINSKVRA